MSHWAVSPLMVAGLAAMVVVAVVQPARADKALQGRSSDGGEICFDGVFYNYRDANAQKGMKMWVPPGASRIRGVVLHGNPGGGGGDTRPIARDERLQEFAARHDLAVMGVTWFPGRAIYDQTGPVMLDVMRDWAKLGRHPEIAHLPIIARGSSNAGITAYSLACLAPERMICFTPNVGPRYNPASPPDGALAVPALLHIGPEDPLLEGGVEITQKLFDDIGPRGALWNWDAEQGKGHQIGHIDDVDLAFYVACLKLRLPEKPGPADQPVTLRPLRREDGWLIDTSSWQSGMTRIAPYGQFEGKKESPHTGWAPTQGIAYLCGALASYDNPLSIRLKDLGSVDNPNAQGVLLRSVGGNVVDPGRRMVLECDAAGMPDWRSYWPPCSATNCPPGKRPGASSPSRPTTASTR